MKIILDTVNKDFFIALVNDTYELIDFFIKENERNKVELIPDTINNLIKNNNLHNINDINEYYVNIGPGSFTGSRIGLVFVRTIAQLNNSKIYTINNCLWIAGPSSNTIINIDAKSNKVYYCDVKNGKLLKPIILKENKDSISFNNPNYELFKNNIKDYLNMFHLEENLLEIQPLYINEPKIGA